VDELEAAVLEVLRLCFVKEFDGKHEFFRTANGVKMRMSDEKEKAVQRLRKLVESEV